MLKTLHGRTVLGALALGLLASSLAPAGAGAATPTGCRASAARAVVAPLATSEPVVANTPGSPCATDTQRVAGVAPVGPVSATAPYAVTQSRAGIVAAGSGDAGVALSLGGQTVSVGVVAAQQMVACEAGKNVASGSSTVDALTIAGTQVPIIAGRSLDLNVGPIRVRTNVLSGDTRQALVLDVAGEEVVLGEATASGDACATLSSGGGDNGSGGGNGHICPKGSIYRADGNVCVIASSASSREGDVIVGAPYEGPSGGSVISLASARSLVANHKLADSVCLHGKGPDYVVLGTSKADKLTGTNKDDRILALGGNDQLDGGRGNDCLDGASGSDTVSGGQGNDHLMGGTGSDHVNGGSGTDVENGGTGNDTINTGFGGDHVMGGSGNDAINAATDGPAARIDAGSGRDTVRINRNERKRVKSAQTVHVIR
jgi:Ca2+-binding RTX toxin-like protein